MNNCENVCVCVCEYKINNSFACAAKNVSRVKITKSHATPTCIKK